MKIAMIGQKGSPATVGGIEYHVEELARELTSRGHSVTVYSRPSYSARPTGWYNGVHVRRLYSVPTKHLDAITHTIICTIDALFKNYDIMHYHAIGPSLVSFLPRLFGVKTVATVHALDWKREKWNALARLILKIGERCAVKFPHKTIVISRTLKSYLAEKYGRKCVYIPNGIRNVVGGEGTCFLEKSGLTPKRYILYVGRLVPEKRALDLIRAFACTPNDFKLAIAGDSSFTDEYVKTLHQCSDSRVIFLGRVVGSDLAELYHGAYMFVLPSELEGMPLVILEAMGYGTCVLVSDIPENLELINAPELKKSLGYSFRCKDISHLQETLMYLIHHPEEVNNTESEAMAWVGKKFSWQSISEDTEKVYQDLLNKKLHS